VSIDSVLRAIICCVRLRHVRESRQRHQAFLCVFTSISTLHSNSRVDTNINDDCTYQAAVELCILLKGVCSAFNSSSGQRSRELNSKVSSDIISNTARHLYPFCTEISNRIFVHAPCWPKRIPQNRGIVLKDTWILC
jgi:hypothetical protein